MPGMTISGRIKGHSYVWIGRDANDEVYEVPVYAPVDSRLVTIGYFVVPHPTAPGQVLPEYELSFEVSCEVSYRYAHIGPLAPRIEAVVPAVPGGYFSLETPLPFAAGELVAHTTGTVQAHNWDFLLTNSSKQNQFTNQARYERDLRHLAFADCPYDYYPEEVRAEYYALLDGGIAQAVQGPSCLIQPEKPGSISGGWFQKPFVAADDQGSSQWALTVGPWGGVIRVIGVDNYMWIYPSETTFVDPKTTPEHCYQDLYGTPRYVYLKLLSDMEIAVAFGDGACPEQLPDGYQVYYR